MTSFVHFKNIQIAYTDTGKGTAVILLHGLLENKKMYAEMLPVLSKRNRVIAVDLLGHGETQCLGYIHSMELMAEAVKAVLDKLRIRKPILIGHSLGGYVSLAFAEKYGQNIKGICLLNATAYPDDEQRKKLRSRSNVLIQKNFTAIIRMSFSNLFLQENLTKHKIAIEKAIVEALKTPIQGYIAAQEGMKIRPDRTTILKNLTCKKLMIIGKNDPVLNYQKAIQEAKETNCSIVEFPDGHMPHIENKDVLIIAIQDFIKKCTRHKPFQ